MRAINHVLKPRLVHTHVRNSLRLGTPYSDEIWIMCNTNESRKTAEEVKFMS
jgi:hypothetical protein